MDSNHGYIKIAAAQLAPVFLNRKQTVEKACDFIAQAGREKAKLVVFPEVFISGYPDWVWVVPNYKKALLDELYFQLIENAVVIPDEATDQLCKTARAAKVHVIIGLHERNSEASNSSLFNTILFIDSEGNILGKHRKLIPTGGERLIWAQGDGNTLGVFETDIGKVGGLICWENYMPLARYAMYALGTQIYAAPTWDSSETWLLSLQHIAREGGMFVIGCCSAIHVNQIPNTYEFKKYYPEGKEWINPGHSCIIGPNGKFLAEPLKMEEGLIFADLDFKQIYASKRLFDVAGHYARPDVFKFAVNQNSE
ncbi:MAG: carbon-nitrogen hydrolase family protein [Calditrichaeota bacterium]|nr:MAG: carbon-nitrogen hydrolase family protein [Calditrichota bacterium]